MYLFLSAMFGIIFSNNLLWLFFFWEVTTLCSFLLIGYRDDKASQDSAFRALNMNLIGGVVFAFGIVYLFVTTQTMELDKLLLLDQGTVLLPAVCFAFAGLAKSAQFPFSSWLTGAMVAPTPVSALLHSSTMVKAGVYLILRVSPVMDNTVAAQMLTLIGGVSFLVTALIAISQSNAKKVLAYSTISNLGLIVACAGVNTPAAVWSALLLIIFHAVAKSLLFLCVGSYRVQAGEPRYRGHGFSHHAIAQAHGGHDDRYGRNVPGTVRDDNQQVRDAQSVYRRQPGHGNHSGLRKCRHDLFSGPSGWGRSFPSGTGKPRSWNIR